MKNYTIIGLSVLSTMSWITVLILTEPLTYFLYHFFADDAFYYYGLARNFPHPQFSPGIITTGFHPLWWVILSGLYHLGSTTFMIKASLLLLITAHVGTGLFIYKLARQRYSETISQLVGSAWIVSVYLRGLSLNGVETPLAVFGAAATLWFCQHSKVLTFRRATLIGVAVGMTYLARTDSIVITSSIVAWYLFRTNQLGKIHWPKILISLVTAAIVASPWLVVLAFHGGIEQDSASALAILRHNWSLVKIIYTIGGMTIHILGLALLSMTSLAVAAITGVLVGAFAVVLYLTRPKNREWLNDLAGIIFGTILLFIFYAIVLHGLRSWYVLYAAFAFFLIALPPVFSFAAEFLEHVLVIPMTKSVLTGIVAILIIAITLISGPAQNPQEIDKYNAAQLIHIHSGERLAAFNAEIYGFFVIGGVYNLDGVVNPTVQASLRNDTLCKYLHDLRITNIVDTPGSLKLLSEYAPGLIITRTVVLVGPGGRIPAVVDSQDLLSINTNSCK